jgi:mono/diheme cytochrome c family protein
MENLFRFSNLLRSNHMKKYFLLSALILTSALFLASCGGGGDTSGDPVAAGEDLFAEVVIGTQAGCITCHSLDEGVVIVGPSMAGVGARLDEAAMRESILDPNAVLVEGFPADTMPPVWADELSDEQVDQLVAYLLTLK